MDTRNYKIKPFIKNNDPELSEALAIYANVTPSCIVTNTNDIFYWIKNYNKSFKPDSFHAIGFYLNNNLIGYAQFVHLLNDKLIIVDYLAIKKESRDNSAFFVFVSQLKDFIEYNRLIYDYVVTEIAYLNHNTNTPSHESQALIRLLKIQKFHVVKANYIQPMLGNTNHESEMKAIMMLFTKSKTTEIKKETYISIVYSIFYNHYLRWYTPLPSMPKNYKQQLDRILKQIKSELQNKETIEINGHHFDYESQTSPIPHYPDVKSEIILMIIFSTSLAIAFSFMNLNRANTILAFIMPMFTYLCVYAVKNKSKEASGIINKLTNLIKSFVKP